MSDVVRLYLAECSKRKVEPFYGFLEHLHDGRIDTDMDFCSVNAMRLFIHALNVAQLRDVSAVAASSSGASTVGSLLQQHPPKFKHTVATPAEISLRVVSLRIGCNRHLLHPPVKSNELRPYAALMARYAPNAPDILLEGNTAHAVKGGPQLHLLTRFLSGLASTLRRHALSVQTLRVSGIQLDSGIGASSAIRPHVSTAKSSSTPIAAATLPSLGFSRLANALLYCRSLTVLDLIDTRIGDVAATNVLASIAQLPQLRELHMAGCSLTDSGATDALLLCISASVSKRSEIQFRNSLRAKECPATSRQQPGSGLVVLNLSRNALGDRFASRLAAAVQHDESMQSLRLDENALSTKGALKLLQALELSVTTSALTFVDLSNNGGVSTDSLLPQLDALHVSGFQVSVEHNMQIVLARPLAANGFPNVPKRDSQTTTSRNPASKSHITHTDPTKAPSTLKGRGTSPVAPPFASEQLSSTTPARAGASDGTDSLEALAGQTYSGTSPIPLGPGAAVGYAGQPPSVSHHFQPMQMMPPAAAGYPHPMMFPLMMYAAMPPGYPPPMAVGGYHTHTMPPHQLPFGQPPFQGSSFPVWNQPPAPMGQQPTQPAPVTEVEVAQSESHGPQASMLPPEGPVRLDELLLDEHVLREEGDIPFTTGNPDDADDEGMQLHQRTPSPSKQHEQKIVQVCEQVLAEERSRLLGAMHELLQQSELTQDAARERFRDDIMLMKQQLESVASDLSGELQSAKDAVLALGADRRDFEREAAAWQDWVACHPEQEMERDVVSLIRAGIDRIRTEFFPQAAAAAPVQLMVDQVKTDPVSKRMTSSSATLQRGWAPTISATTASFASAKPATSSANPEVDFLGDVKKTLGRLGW